MSSAPCAIPIPADLTADGALLDARAFRRWALQVSTCLDQRGLDALECEMRALAELGRGVAPTAAHVLADPDASPTLRSRAFLTVAMAMERVLSGSPDRRL